MASTKTQADYENLIRDLEAEENRTGLYLADVCVDRENALVDGRTEKSLDFWAVMFDSAKSAADFRREEQS